MTNKPHDALFKAGFGHPERAAEYLRSVLPAAIVDAIDWSTMKHESGSFIYPDLGDHHTDLLFSADLHTGDPALIYMLLEHRSTIARDMLLRLLEYLIGIWRHHHDQHALPLPLTISLVISHAPGGWTAARTMHELFDPHPSAIPHLETLVPNFTMLVDDLAHLSNDDIKARALSKFSKLVLWVLRDARNAEELLKNFTVWGSAFGEAQQTPNGMESVRLLLRYIALVAKDLHSTQFRANIHLLAPEVQETAMTLAEELWAEGRIQGQVSVLSKQLALKFGELPPSYVARLTSATLVEIDVWVERVLSATTLDEVFA